MVAVTNSKTLSVSIKRKPDEVYDYIFNPENFRNGQVHSVCQ